MKSQLESLLDKPFSRAALLTCMSSKKLTKNLSTVSVTENKINKKLLLQELNTKSESFDHHLHSMSVTASGWMSGSEKLLTHPSPNPTLTQTCYQSIITLGRGRCVVAKIPTFIGASPID